MKNKFLEKLTIAICLTALLITPIPTFAQESISFQDSITYNSIISDAEMDKRIEELGNQIAYSKNNLNSSRSATDEYWYLESSKTLKSNSAISSKYITILATNETAYPSTVTFNFGSNIEICKIPINFGVSYTSKYSSFSGPSFSDTVGNTSKVANHSFLVAVQYGAVVEYKYRVETGMGNIVRYETITTVTDGGAYIYNLRANVANNGSIIVEGSNRNATKSYNNKSHFINSLGHNKAYNVLY